MSCSIEETFLFALICKEVEEQEEKQKREWVHPICKDRNVYGEYHTLFTPLTRDKVKFFQYFRMSHVKFVELFNIVKNDLKKNDTSFRRAIPPKERLAVCLKFLVTGESFRALAFSFRMGHTTVREIVHECCKAIWKRLAPIVLPKPTKEQWKTIEKEFYDRWNFPNCIGALDGKHIMIEAPSNSGSLYFNYKKTFSVVLMALVDANYQFIAVDVGAYGKNSDGGILMNSVLGKSLLNGTLDIPEDKPLPGTSQPAVPHVIVGDEAFPLRKNIMRPYPGSQLENDESKKIFNYRLSRARRISENAFGILTQKFRIFQGRIKMKVEHVDNVVLATCCLHNFMRSCNNRNILTNDSEAGILPPQTLAQIGASAANEAIAVRETFRNYFISEVGSVQWQVQMVRQGRRVD